MRRSTRPLLVVVTLIVSGFALLVRALVDVVMHYEQGDID